MKLALVITLACTLAAAQAGASRGKRHAGGGHGMGRRMMLFKKCNLELVRCARDGGDAFEAAGFGSFELAMNKALGAHKEAFACVKESPCFAQIMCMMKSDSSKTVMGCLKEGFMGMRQAHAGEGDGGGDEIVARVRRAIEVTSDGDDDDSSSGSDGTSSSEEEGGHGHGGRRGGRRHMISRNDKIAMVLKHGPMAADMVEKFCGADETAALKACIIKASGLGESAEDCDRFMALVQAAGCGCKAEASEQCAAMDAKRSAMMSAMVELKCACAADHADAVRADFDACTGGADMPQMFADVLEGTCDIDLDKCDDGAE